MHGTARGLFLAPFSLTKRFKTVIFTIMTRKDQHIADTADSAEDREFESIAKSIPRLANLRALLLNADMQPMWYYPLSTVAWPKLMFWIVKGEQTGIPRINVIDTYEGVYVNSGTRKIALPSVVSHVKMVDRKERAPLTRFNIYLRDNFTCQYTGKKLPPDELNLDHVIPRSKGGDSSWTNLVACWKELNQVKADRTPKEAGLKLIRNPAEPSPYQLYQYGRAFPPQFLHESWSDYLFWDTELDEETIKGRYVGVDRIRRGR